MYEETQKFKKIVDSLSNQYAEILQEKKVLENKNYQLKVEILKYK